MSMIVKKKDFVPGKLKRVRFAVVTERNGVRLARFGPSGCCW